MYFLHSFFSNFKNWIECNHKGPRFNDSTAAFLLCLNGKRNQGYGPLFQYRSNRWRWIRVHSAGDAVWRRRQAAGHITAMLANAPPEADKFASAASAGGPWANTRKSNLSRKGRSHTGVNDFSGLTFLCLDAAMAYILEPPMADKAFRMYPDEV